jgi:hypothetical protein
MFVPGRACASSTVSRIMFQSWRFDPDYSILMFQSTAATSGTTGAANVAQDHDSLEGRTASIL